MYRSRSSKVRYYKCDIWRCSPSAFESQLRLFRRYMIQILLLRLCWQLNSCAILKILEYQEETNTEKRRQEQLNLSLDRTLYTGGSLFFYRSFLSSLRTGQISAIICTNENILMLLIKYFDLFTTGTSSTRRPPTSPISYTTHNWQFCFLYHVEFLQLNSYPKWTISTQIYIQRFSLVKLELKSGPASSSRSLVAHASNKYGHVITWFAASKKNL